MKTFENPRTSISQQAIHLGLCVRVNKTTLKDLRFDFTLFFFVFDLVQHCSEKNNSRKRLSFH